MSTTKIKIANTDMEAYPFVLGGNVFGWTVNETDSFAILDTYLSKGFSLIDTADVYSVWAPGNKGGESETILGKWIHSRKNRDKFILATKVGGEIDSTHKGLKREYIISEVEQSLQRLQTDYIDIYYTHYDDLSVPVEEVLQTYADLIKQGKIRFIGTSNMSTARIEESIKAATSNGLPSYLFLQPEYNLYDRATYEKEYQPLSEKYGLSVFPFYSLANGFLTGKYHSKADLTDNKRKERLENYFDTRGMHLLQTLHSLAKSISISPAQLSLAWLMHQPTITAPIASVSRPEQLDILEAVNIHLNEEVLSTLNRIPLEHYY